MYSVILVTAYCVPYLGKGKQYVIPLKVKNVFSKTFAILSNAN